LADVLKKGGSKCIRRDTVENLTFMEPMASREQEEVVMALSKIHGRRLRIMGPSPSMTNGWVAFDEAGNRVQHAGSVFILDPLGETARLELEAVENPAVPPRRLYGKQPLSKEVGKVPQPPARVVQVPAQGELEAPGPCQFEIWLMYLSQRWLHWTNQRTSMSRPLQVTQLLMCL